MSRTLLDLPDKLAEPLERNAVAVEMSDAPADDLETVHELVEEISTWTGSEAPTLLRGRPGHGYKLETGLHPRSVPKHRYVHIDQWGALDKLEHPLKGRLLSGYEYADRHEVARLVADLHWVRTRYDTLRDTVHGYNARVDEMTGLVDGSDLRAFARSPDDKERIRLLLGHGGMVPLLAWTMVSVQKGSISREAAGNGRLEVDVPSDLYGKRQATGRLSFDRLLDRLRREGVEIYTLDNSDWQIQDVAADYRDDEVHIEIRIERAGDDGGEA